MKTRTLSLASLAWLALACSDPAGPTMPPPASGGGGGAAGSAMPGGAGMGGGGAGAGAGGVAGGGMPGGGMGGGGSPGISKATQLKDSGLFSASAMGLLPDGVTTGPVMTMVEGVHPFTPQYALWSDSAGKRRWVYMPPGKQIITDFDSSGMDYWRYPGGFKLWKEFSRDNKVIETRLMEKLGDGAGDWYMVAFKWNADYTDAVAVPLGDPNSMGTEHDVPGEEACKTCHSNMVDHGLGFSALQLAHDLPDSGVNLTQIAAMGWLSTPPAAPIALPGTEVEKAAFGYLHSNCGMCHNARSNVYRTAADLDLWTHTNELSAGVSGLRGFLSMVCDEWPGPGTKTSPITSCSPGHATGAHRESSVSALPKRILPQNAAMSAIHELMALRETADTMRQMPPVGTEMPDSAGLAAVEAWINALPLE